jgi:hypothetical protein
VPVTVTNVAPTFEAGADEVLNPPQAGVFSRGPVSFADPGTLDIWSGTVNFGDGTGNQTLAISQLDKTFALNHTYTTQGAFTVTVSLKDYDSSAVIDSFPITVILNWKPRPQS